jgi:hypothetical protein
MTLEQIQSKKQKNLDTIGEEFGKQVEESQNEVLPLIIALLALFSYDKNGNISFDTANYARVNAFMDGVDGAVAGSKYFDTLVFLMDKVDAQAELTREMYRKMGLDPDAVSGIDYEAQATSMLEDLTNFKSGFSTALRNFILASIASGSDRTALEEGIAQIVKGGAGKKGLLFDTATLTADTMFAVIDRSFTFAMGEALGIKKYLYAGGLVNDSRPFCVARDGKVFTKEEVRSWGKLGDWKGKIVGTDESTIFIYLGGYRCRHWLVPQV